MGKLARSGLLYGLAAFAIGFVLGVLREVVLIPHFGERTGHLLEFPLVTTTVALAGGLFAYRHGAQEPCRQWLMVGCIAVAVLIAIESSFALLILQQPLDVYLAAYDVSRGALFPFGLLVMAVAPAIGCLLRRQGD